MTKQDMEMQNLRRRVEAQREELTRLREDLQICRNEICLRCGSTNSAISAPATVADGGPSMNYDDLIQRLRNGTRLPMIQSLLNEAADAIEELIARLEANDE